ncbi:MAG: peptidoglycan-binding protein [Hyphomicrobiales bacterium]|nr:peptidoglycan-binding protein [Hyphomicrobiales bacterium]
MARSGRGFEDDARQRVIDAARRSGVSVGDLVQALAEPPRRGRDDRAGADLERRLDDLSERMRRLGGDRPARAPRVEPADDAALEEIAAAVGRLSGATSARPRAAAGRSDETGRILETLEALDRRVRALGDDRAPRRAEPPKPRRSTPAAPPLAAAADPLELRFRELGDKIDQLRTQEDRDGSSALLAEIRALRTSLESRTGDAAEVSGEIRRLAGRIDRLAEQRPQREVVESLATELGRLRDVVLQSNVEGSLRTIEQGYGQIVDRLDDLKQGLSSRRDESRIDDEIAGIREMLRAVPPLDQLSALERNLNALSDKFERLTTRVDSKTNAQIERRLADLRAQIEGFDPAKIVVSLDQRLKAVGDKLDALERSARAPAAQERVITLLEELRTLAAGNRAADDIRTVERRLAELGDRIADFDARRPSWEDTDRLHQRIAEIADRLDRIAVDDDRQRSAEALDAAVARLDAAIVRSATPPASERFDARFDEILDRLDRAPASSATADVEELTREIAAMRRDLAANRSTDDLEEQMRLLAERLDRSVAHEGDDDALAQIEDQLARISQQIEANQDRIQDFSGVEAQILRLADRMENQRDDSVAAAREAAREMVRELAGATRDGGLSEETLLALKDDLRALQSAAHDTESRTNETLVSLHDALTGIVGRLAAIEKIAQGSARSAAAARSAAQAAETAAQSATQSTPPARAIEPVEEPIAPEESPAQPTIAGRPVGAGPVARARELLAAASPEDTRPLEPGSGKPSAKPAAAIRASAPPIAAATAAPAAARKADFIAAARRAAQAAASTASAPPKVEAADRATRLGVAEPAASESEGGALSRIGKVLKNRRRPLVLATAAVVLAILTLQMLPGGQPAKNQTAEATIERSRPVEEPQTSVAERSAETVAPKPAEGSVLSKSPTGAPQVGFSMPMSTEGSAGSTIAQPATTATGVAPTIDDKNAQQSKAEDAPATTGSIPTGASTAPAAAAPTTAPAQTDALLPEKIGPEALRRAAAGGDVKAMLEVGLRFSEGKAVSADLAKAVAWYEKAAAKGYAPAQYRLGIAYEKGLGTARDSEKAKAAYRAAAEQGNLRAMHNLGVIYANGRDMANAVTWFQKAADLGLRDSQFNLGIINALGSGVKQDLAVSYKWFALAARQGDGEAEKKMNEVAGHLDKVNLAAARMAVQTWVQRPLDHAANDELRAWGDPATASAAQPTPSPADRIEMVRQAQMMLKAKGLYSGVVDGDVGPGTRSAIVAFQKKSGLPQTGEIDGALLQALSGRAL